MASDRTSSALPRASDRTRRGFAHGCAAGLAGALAGCSFVGEQPSDVGATPASVPGVTTTTESSGSAGPVLTVAHWNRRGDQRAAYDAMVQSFLDIRPEVRIQPPQQKGILLSKSGIERQINRGYPPGVWQSEPGGELRTLAAKRLLLDIGPTVWQDRAVEPVYPQAIAGLAQSAGAPVAVPWYGERLNNLFYNVPVLDRVGVDPTTLDGPEALLTALESVAAETEVTPLAVGTNRPSQVGQLFEAVLLAQVEPRGLSRMLSGEAGTDLSQAIDAALGTVAELSSFFPDDATDIGWIEAAERVVDGRAATTVCRGSAVGGPAATVGFPAHDETASDQWAHTTVPGTAGVFQFTAQSFVGTANNPTPTLTREWLRFCASARAQRRFCTVAEAVPLRTDIDPESLGPFAREQYRDYREASAYTPSITHGLVLAPDASQQYLSALYDFTDTWNVETTAERVVSALER